ncbi:BnaC04g52290D [Brassica napus]|uniref:BnaC04g52290D protein n=1 Tax=Brassica napus TaxID=3708 RepID=A0A078IWB2_BRANA|nr:BnaC04g52290D [Brassica napus]
MGSLRGNVEEPISQSLPRQNSLYSLKLHEVQNHLGSSAKPLGSMNLDELLKSPREATEAGLSRQGSLALPRGLSKKTVEEVWREIQHDKNGSSGNPHGERIDNNNNNKQPTLGEITLEDLLLKAGVVTETVLPQTVVNVASNEPWVQYHHPQHQQQGFMPYPVCEMQEMVSPMNMMMGDAPQAHGRKGAAPSGGDIVERVVERRQKRMIKNRESAARSRARKQQAYTHELEIKVSSLEEENEKLRRLKEVEKILPSEPPPDPKWKLRRTSSASF